MELRALMMSGLPLLGQASTWQGTVDPAVGRTHVETSPLRAAFVGVGLQQMPCAALRRRRRRCQHIMDVGDQEPDGHSKVTLMERRVERPSIAVPLDLPQVRLTILHGIEYSYAGVILHD